jgi:hypothetical protein
MRALIGGSSGPAFVGNAAVQGHAMQGHAMQGNPNRDARRWKNVKRKTDKDDALKLAELSNVTARTLTARIGDA